MTPSFSGETPWLLVAILRFAVAERLLWGEYQDFFVKEGILQPEVFDP